MAKATKRSRRGRRLERKHEAWFPLRRPALLAALGLAGWAPAGAADFPPTLNLSILDGTNGFRLDGVMAGDRSGSAVSGAGDVNGDGLADLVIGATKPIPTDGRDRLFGGPGRDRLFGGAGRDELRGEKGRDALNGGTG